jgi:hypothetical protein
MEASFVTPAVTFPVWAGAMLRLAHGRRPP